MEIASTQASPNDPEWDLGSVDTANWPQRSFPLPGTREAGISVIVRQSVLNEIHRHGLSRTDIEICGVLVGNGYQDASGPFVYIEASIRGEHATHLLTRVKFTAETWIHIQEVMDREHANQRIVGWYHTHPGFGIFLSDFDLFIQKHFFGSPEQMAFVYDPLSGDEGFFVWRKGQPNREPVLIENDVAAENDAATGTKLGRLNLAPIVNTSTQNDRDRPFQNARLPICIGLVMAGLLLIGSFLTWRFQTTTSQFFGGNQHSEDLKSPSNERPAGEHSRSSTTHNFSHRGLHASQDDSSHDSQPKPREPLQVIQEPDSALPETSE